MPGSGERHHRTQETGRTVLSGAAIRKRRAASGAVAHDFNNLLTVINGYTEITFDSLPAGSHLAQRLGEGRSAGRRTAELTQQLLAFSRKQVVQPTVLDVNSMVNNIEKMRRRIIREDIALVTVLAPDAGNVKADVGQVEQMIMNLAVNARDAMPTGGALTIETANFIFEEKHCKANPEISASETLAVTNTR